ncbi:hypothetical protein CGLAU_07665 [Corynebacterium glaucum]|uniref:EfeO-type cupredoxin-like domain-containing protein n=2 Tax=Corynebacterium glaucum TaxID=187491 RepID=A0A1Q2HXB6_9CORY|nr:hypothetical protein CGLAU_07665 [Corynebacterium glaucum]WJZ07990.1 hypothetical protein CGLAUT_07545 [Corynebacterium glaucum]
MNNPNMTTRAAQVVSRRADVLAWLIVAALITTATICALVRGESSQSPDGPALQDIRITGMEFTPSSIEVDSSTHVVLRITNDDSREHNLKLGSGFTGPIYPGDSVVYDFGTFESDTQGWCTKAGHKAMGMVYDVTVRE